MPSGTPLGNMFIELGLDTSQFSPKLQSAKREVNYFKAETRALDTALKSNSSNVSLLTNKYKSLQNGIEAQKKVLTKLKTEFDKMEPGTAKWEAAAVGIEKENAKLVAMEGQLNQVSFALQKVSSQNSFWGKMSTEFDKASNKLKTISTGFNKFGDLMKPVSLAMSGGFAYATKKAVDFEGQLKTTRALLADTVPAKNLDAVINQLADSSKKWAVQYGLSTSAVNDGMQEMVKKGYDAQQVMGAMPAVLDASRASGEDFNTVMNASTSILEQFGLTSKTAQGMIQNTQRVTDSLTFVANKTAAGFSDMGNAMEYVGPVAKSVGISVEDTAAAIGLLSNNGIEGEKAGTALRGALTRLLKPSRQNANAMEQLGFSAEEFKKGQIGLPDIIDRIKKSTEGMTDAEKASLIAKAFGTEAQTGMNALVNQGGDALRKLTDETKNATGYTKDLAKEMSESSKAKVERFKSSLEVLGVTVGQKLLPTLTPIIEKLTKLVNKFADADPKTQKFILTLAGIAAAASPVSKTIGGVTNATSSLLGIFSKIARKKAAATAIEELGTSAVGATTSVSGLASGSGILASLLTPGGALVVGLIAAAGASAYFGAKAIEAHQRTETWGTSVNEMQSSKLYNFKTKVDEASKSITAFGGSSQDVDNVKKSFQNLVTEIEKLENKNLRKKINLAEKLGLSQETIEEIKQSSQQTVTNAKQMSDEVIDIYQNASNQHRQLTSDEKAIVLQNQNELINTQLSLMKFSYKERKAITQAMTGDINKLNKTQLQSALAVTRKWIDDENKVYKERKRGLKESYDSIHGTDQKAVKAKEEIHKKLQALEADHTAKMDAYGQKYVKIQKKLLNDELKGLSPDVQQGVLEGVKKQMKELGLSYDELIAKTTKASSKTQEMNSMWAKTTKEATSETKLANSQWNALTWDTKKGEVKTNAKEEIAKALEAEGGWENLKFIAKNANLSTNARLTMAQVLQETGKWDTLTPEEKKLVVDGHKGLQAIAESKQNLAIWNSMPESVKKLLGNNKNFLDNEHNARQALLNWNDISPDEKKLLAKNLTGKGKEEAQKTINSLVGKEASLSAKDNTAGGVSSAHRQLSTVNDKTVTITAVYKAVGAGKIGVVSQFAKGTNYHPGGLAMVNDQQGSLYKELVTLPNGQSFIPNGRDVILPLPKGSKVMKASMTRDYMRSLGVPRYASGIGIPEDSTFIRSIDTYTKNDNAVTTINYDDSKMVQLLSEILLTVRKATSQTNNSQGDVLLDLKKVGKLVADVNTAENVRQKRLRGELV
ncbi:TPA: phage tail tape measure protein [Streptococcus agalactiae]|nr:phage tail tape measure protein [Streptococcus agalactiae]